MKAIVILWNAVQDFKDEMLADIDKNSKILYVKQLDLNEKYESFVRDIYASEHMEEWKIDNKVLHMINRKNNEVTMLIIDIDKGEVVFHDKKKKNVYSNVEGFKKFMRDRYKERVQDYYFDIVYHMTDNEREFLTCFDVIKKYDMYLKSDDILML